METHVWIRPDRFKSVGQPVQVDGVDLQVQLSPYDAPTSIRGRYRADTKDFEIRFEYMDEEPPGRTRTVKHIRFVEGRYSEKLLAIIIPVDKKPLNKVGIIRLQSDIVEALENRAEALDPNQHSERPFGRFLNLKAAKDVVENTDEFESVTRELVAQ
jgi:hypothetical protein